MLLLLLSRFSRVRPCATPQMAAHQAPPSLGFSRQERWTGLPFPSPMHESGKWKWSRSVVSDSWQRHGLQPTRLLHPWDFPGNSTGVGWSSYRGIDTGNTSKDLSLHEKSNYRPIFVKWLYLWYKHMNMKNMKKHIHICKNMNMPTCLHKCYLFIKRSGGSQ